MVVVGVPQAIVLHAASHITKMLHLGTLRHSAVLLCVVVLTCMPHTSFPSPYLQQEEGRECVRMRMHIYMETAATKALNTRVWGGGGTCIRRSAPW
jgi:hypothetical protein